MMRLPNVIQQYCENGQKWQTHEIAQNFVQCKYKTALLHLQYGSLIESPYTAQRFTYPFTIRWLFLEYAQNKA